jgi:hypothetical protein
MKTYSRRDLILLLSPTLGPEQAAAVVIAAARPHGHELSRTEALSILDKLATSPGIAGIAALFVKSHLILNHA